MMELWRRNFIIGSGFLEALLFSGCLFGWPSLLLILQEEGIYSHVCPEQLNINSTRQQQVLDTPALHRMGQYDTSPLESTTNVLVSLSQLTESQPGVKKWRSCDEQRVEMTLIYTFAAISYGITALFIGMSLEVLGLRVTRLIGSTLLCGGFMFLTLTDQERSWLLWFALNLIALGSNQLRFSAFQFADLWPEYRATILTTYSSAYAVSTTFFLLMQLIYEASVPYSTIFSVCGVVGALTFVPTFFMPPHKIEVEGDVDVAAKESTDSIPMVTKPPAGERDNSTNSDDTHAKTALTLSKDNNTEDSRVGEDSKGGNGHSTNLTLVLKSVVSVSGVLHMYWHFINLFLILFYSSTLNIWAYKVTTEPASVSFYIKMSGICCLIAPVFIPFSGLLTDKMIGMAKKKRSTVERLAYTMQAPTYSMAGATTLLALTMTCKLFVNETAIYLSLILIALARPATIGACTAYIRLRFPAEQFNLLNGIFTTIISIICFVQYPIMKWMTSSDKSYTDAHWLLLSCLIMSLASPFHMMLRRNAMKFARERLTRKE